MACRFTPSKYKNAAPILMKTESCVRDISVGYYQTHGNNIASSAAFMAFNCGPTGSSVGVLPLDDCGRNSHNTVIPLLNGHTDTVNDLEFSPFHDGLLATASKDKLVKIWHIPEEGLETSLTEPECVFAHKQGRVETLGFHPTADYLLYSTAGRCLTLFDISTQAELFCNNEHPDIIQSASWCHDGRVLVTSCKDKQVRIFDPRSTGSSIQQTAESHESIKDSRVIWLGSQPRILTTGFDAARARQVIIRDIRNFATIEKSLELDCSTGILMPLFDADTNMLFLAGKGDTMINLLEVTDKKPYFIEGFCYIGKQTKGVCLVPKRALKVMEAEVNRVLHLTANSVTPIMYQVPRRTYAHFHVDLYPDTAGYRTELMANEWFNGTNMPLQKIHLDPAKRELGDAPITIHRGTLGDMVATIENLTLYGGGDGGREGGDIVCGNAEHGHMPPLATRPNISSMESPTEHPTDSSEKTSLSMNDLAQVGGAATFMMSDSPESSSGVPCPRTTATLSSDKVFAFPMAPDSMSNMEQLDSYGNVTTSTTAEEAAATPQDQPLPELTEETLTTSERRKNSKSSAYAMVMESEDKTHDEWRVSMAEWRRRMNKSRCQGPVEEII